MNKVAVVIPTYNERKNLPELLEKIFSLNSEGLFVYIVDDNSPDRTGELAETLKGTYPLEVLHRQKKDGLGSAYTEAFQKIIASKNDYRYIVQMDADLSHDPADISGLLKKAESCDVVLGSRYSEGGGVKNWGVFRKEISILGNVYARLMLNLPYNDLTGGFKCWNIQTLKNIDFANYNVSGYFFQIYTTYLAHKKGHTICEVPIIFKDRIVGKSKFNIGIILECIYKVMALRWK